MLHCNVTMAVRGRSLAGLVAALGLLLAHPVAAAPSAVSSGVPAPTMTGPIVGGLRGGPWGASIDDLESAGYVEEEYFFSGTADSRDLTGALDGRRSAEYTTRMLVRRPKSAEAFNGTVLMEWFNVTAEMDFGVLWGMSHVELLRGGYAYAGVSVQKVGVDASPLALKLWDPVRYLPLQHPGDAYAFDIWSQAARALVARDGPSPLGTLRPKRILASGESQSAAYMIPYVNRVDPDHRTFDGFLAHSYPGRI
ncbi:MAG TPA: alpha/beta hydrolase domain-containing protein, partial [Nevskiaceae bacterium]|nr:alpha/beta hydrolase domain-containing protein [Nevskiaceae bacterium]